MFDKNDRRFSFLSDIKADDPRITRLLEEMKDREAIGYAYEAADASFELLARRMLGKVPNYLRRRRNSTSMSSSASMPGASA